MLRTVRLPWFLLCSFIALLLAAVLGLGSHAYGQRSEQVYNSLAKSRDALLDQRRYLQAEADKLQKQMDTVNVYLRDNDRALRDVEYAMRRN